MSKLRLHPKHGLNPTVPVCFFCGRDIGEVALLGAAYPGEAPKNLILSKQPCDKCLSDWSVGIAFIESTSSDINDVTGRLAVLTEEATKRLLTPSPELLEFALRRRIVLCEPEVMDNLLQHSQENPNV